MPAQDDFLLNHLTVNEGLSQSTIYCITQDSDGFIWIGTRYGLNRYDGYNFDIYLNDKDDTASLADNQVFCLLELMNGDILAGTDNGLSIYKKGSDSFISYRSIEKNSSSLINNHIYALFEDSKGTVWVGTDGGGICHFNYSTGTFKPFRQLNQLLKRNDEIRIRSITETAEGEIWIATKGDGLFIYSIETGKLRQVTLGATNNVGLLSNSIRIVYQDKPGNIWIGSDEDGLTRYNPSTNTISYFRENYINGISHNAIRAIIEDSNGTLWVGTRVGLNRYDKQKGGFVQYFHNANNNKTLSHNSIRSIFEDNNGNLWFGTYYGGINILYGSSQNFLVYKPNNNNPNSLSYEVVSSFVEDENGNIWIGTEGGGLNRFSPTDDKFTVYRHRPGKPGISNNNVKALHIDRHNNLWIGTYGSGIDIMPLHGGKIKNHRCIPADTTTISSNNIYSFLHDTRGRMWIGTNQGGLNLYNYKLGSFKRIGQTNNKGETIIGNTVNAIAEGSNGQIWFATDIGLARFDGKEFHKIGLFNENNKPAADINVLALMPDSAGTIWIGTEDFGLFSYDTKKGSVQQISQINGLSGNIIYGIVQDNNNHLWISTNRGLLKFPLTAYYNKKNLNDAPIIVYDINDGLQGNEFNRGAYYRSRNGAIYFGGLKGFNSFKLENITQNMAKPPVVITSFYLSNEKVVSYGGNSPLKQHISKTEIIELGHKQSSFRFDFVALNFDKPQKNQYAYMLEGFDNNWVVTGKNRYAVYTNIDPGEYVFRVKASNNDNLWNNEGTSIKLVIHPPFWQTRWAFLIYFITAILLMFAFRQSIVYRTTQKHLLENERLEKIRIDEINQMKLRVFTNISHEFRTPLTLIAAPLEKLLQEPDMEKHKQHYLHSLMYKSALRLQRLINQLMDFRKLENKKMKLNVAPGNMEQFVVETVNFFEEYCRQKNILLQTKHTSDSATETWFDHNIVDNIIFILLSNAVKFTPPGGTITIETQNGHGTANIIVSDTGIGIPPEKLNHIFERFYSDNSLKYTKSIGTGIGLDFAQSLVELHKGTVKVESEPEKGTTFTVSLPVDREIYDDSEISAQEPPFTNQRQEFLPEVLPSDIDMQGQTEAESVLIVEDNMELRGFIKGQLASYQLFEAENGKEALKIARKMLPDLIISDIMMPVMDGLEFCRQIKSNSLTSHIPVILLTAKINIENKLEGAALGADLYMEKPFNMQLLEANVKNLLNQRRALREHYSGQISSEKPEDFINKYEDGFIKKARQIIFERKSDPELSVEQLGEQLGLSRSQLFRKFKAVTAQSPNEFIKTVRLKYATELMAAGELNINQISFECGFTSASHFIASFKKHFKKTPKEYSMLMNLKQKGDSQA
ncbi:MAG: response regulator [Bacteroidales bacterium]|nr:response regulator [Bacteroidales bacterium]